MRVGATTDMPETRCLNCDEVIDVATEIASSDKDHKPVPGAMSLCLKCGYLAAFTEDMTLRELSPMERYFVSMDPRVIAVRQFIKESRRTRED